MRRYWQYFKIAYQSGVTYRGAVVIKGIRDILSTLFFVLLWIALFKSRQVIGGFTLGAMISYYVLAKIIDQFYSYEHAEFLFQDITRGDLSNFLVKPVSYVGYLAHRAMGRKLARITFSLVIVLALLVIFPAFINPPQSPAYLVLFLISGIVSWILIFEITFIVGELSFWFSEVSGVKTAADQLVGLLGGFWIPLNFFPAQVQTLLNLLPFKYLYYQLIGIYQGKYLFPEILQGLTIQIVWVAVFGSCLAKLWRKGLRAYGAYGN